MSAKALLVVLIAVALLLAAGIHLHRPQSGRSATSFSLHGGR
jgi:hypothetical protein